uniref:Uncharacterized protein n=1 Tax=Anguilla anguilla TaxID=7936 RepID=A0A0E9U1Z4_ANGAN
MKSGGIVCVYACFDESE